MPIESGAAIRRRTVPADRPRFDSSQPGALWRAVQKAFVRIGRLWKGKNVRIIGNSAAQGPCVAPSGKSLLRAGILVLVGGAVLAALFIPGENEAEIIRFFIVFLVPSLVVIALTSADRRRRGGGAGSEIGGGRGGCGG